MYPILGLQYFMLAKLEWLFENTDQGLELFVKAFNSLRLTHGKDNPLVVDLQSRIQEATAESAYRSRSGVSAASKPAISGEPSSQL